VVTFFSSWLRLARGYGEEGLFLGSVDKFFFV
jgi:hypothetical protein